MPSFESHYWLGKKVGTVTALLGGLTTLILTFDPAWTLLGAVLGYYSTVVGSVAPDIDLSQPKGTLKYASIPYRQFILVCNFLIVVCLALGLSMYNQGGIEIRSAIVSIVAVGAAIVLIRFLPNLLHGIMPKHRGITHGFTFWILMSAVFGYTIHWLLSFLGYSSIVLTALPAIVGVGVLMGSFTHMSSDSISTLAKKYAPASMGDRLPWVPRKLPLLFDLPSLLKVGFDRKAPTSVRFLVVLTAGYAVLPFDIITDLIPIIGWSDDFTIYMYLRRTVYNSYERDIGVIGGIKRDFQLLDQVILPALILGGIALVALIVYL